MEIEARRALVTMVSNKKELSMFRRLKRLGEEAYGAASIRLLHGERSVSLNDNELSVTCLLKNGEYYVRAFIEHYSALGAKHIFFLDNGSTDKTVDIATSYPNVSVFRSTIPVSKYQALLKRRLAKAVVHSGWCLDVDIDEFFVYPGQEQMSIDQLLSYLNEHEFDAVVTQMLDMFSDKPLSHLQKRQDEDIASEYRYYDIDAVESIGYRGADIVARYGPDNILSHEGIGVKYGGVRKALYGLRCLLTKHSLFRMDRGLELFPSVHFVNRARLADFSCALLHYKMTSDALETAIQNAESFTATSQGYRDFLDVIATQPEFSLKQESSRTYSSLWQLVDDGFLVTSSRFKDYCESIARSITT